MKDRSTELNEHVYFKSKIHSSKYSNTLNDFQNTIAKLKFFYTSYFYIPEKENSLDHIQLNMYIVSNSLNLWLLPPLQ